ncbi:MAG: phosphoribosyl transferase [Deltaproteobacteria bacterium RIFCSPLOWO2_02_56_12]|nr:MAG: phosphoribosyl transferase [Deltaproteobacteria bacterium RIFCSPLOWO2_02_56_12]
MPFQNREQAAHLLARRLEKYRGQNPLVLAIPRGAVPMARIIADSLGGEMDVVLVHKLGAPGEPELAIGAVDETGQVYLAEYAQDLEISDDYINAEKQTQLETLRKRRALYTPLRPPIDPCRRIVIVVDNGVATGSTMISALRAVRARKPARLIAAAAVASRETLRKIASEADETICLEVPARFYAVGQFFEDFSQVSDEQVVAIMLESSSRKRAVGE